jgi:hypothetical protein
MDLGVKALNTHPVKSHKNDPGLACGPDPALHSRSCGMTRCLQGCPCAIRWRHVQAWPVCVCRRRRYRGTATPAQQARACAVRLLKRYSNEARSPQVSDTELSV